MELWTDGTHIHENSELFELRGRGLLFLLLSKDEPALQVMFGTVADAQ